MPILFKMQLLSFLSVVLCRFSDLFFLPLIILLYFYFFLSDTEQWAAVFITLPTNISKHLSWVLMVSPEIFSSLHHLIYTSTTFHLPLHCAVRESSPLFLPFLKISLCLSGHYKLNILSKFGHQIFYTFQIHLIRSEIEHPRCTIIIFCFLSASSLTAWKSMDPANTET